MKLAALALLFFVVLATPATARAEPASIVSRDLPLGASPRSSAGVAVTPRFTLVGLHWRGSGGVDFRVRRLGGRWSGWLSAAPEDEDRPDAASAEGRLPGWRLGNPYWTGPSDRIEYRTRGEVRRLRAHFVWSSAEPAPRRVAVAGSPAIVPRLSWGANEAIKRGLPVYAQTLRFAVVHHTAGSNGYTRAQSAAIVKAIQLYHVRGNGWNDIGYNFLVDRFGQVFEGRFGGMEQNVVGAHAEGFNTGSLGVAVLGSYDARSLSPAAGKALAGVIAWRLDLAHVDPLSTLNVLSGGNSRFPRGVPVFLRAVIGHRDTGFTTCPGDRLYDQLGQLAGDVSRAGLPKLYEPQVRGTTGGRVRFRARLSAPLPWTVTVADALGATVATGTGTGAAVDWTWDSVGTRPGTYTWTIAAGGLRPARGTLGTRAVALALTELAAQPSSVTPNGDGRDDSAVVSYRLSVPATVTAKLIDLAGDELSTLFSERREAGRHRFVFSADGIPDGMYQVVLTAAAGGRQVTASVAILVNRTLSGFAPTRALFSPNGDGRLDTLGFTFALAAPATVTLRIMREGAWVATPFRGELGAGPQRLTWDGSKRLGRLLDGTYEAELEAADVVGTVAQRVPFSSDTTAPRLGLLGSRPLRFRVSEAAEVVLTVDGRRIVVKAERAGAYRVPGAVAPRRVRAVAWDAAGNASWPVRHP